MDNRIGWAIFGTPEGLQAKCGGCISRFDLRDIVDLDNRYIKLFPQSRLLCVYREERNNSLVSYCSLYGFAREIKTDRPGTFYGSTLVLVDCMLPAPLILKVLGDLAASVAQHMSGDQRFTSAINSIGLPAAPAWLPEARAALIPVAGDRNFSIGSLEGIIQYKHEAADCQEDFFTTALSAEYGRVYSRIYGSADPALITFIKGRDKIKLIRKGLVPLQAENIHLRKQMELLSGENDRLKDAFKAQAAALAKEANDWQQKAIEEEAKSSALRSKYQKSLEDFKMLQSIREKNREGAPAPETRLQLKHTGLLARVSLPAGFNAFADRVMSNTRYPIIAAAILVLSVLTTLLIRYWHPLVEKLFP